ncbi:MAG: hypothetical protein ACYC26_16200 [Phycisphaerales bacterium]
MLWPATCLSAAERGEICSNGATARRQVCRRLFCRRNGAHFHKPPPLCMDTFDRALWIALQKSKIPKHTPRYVTDLLRSWCLVLRAGDSRLGSASRLELTSDQIRRLCKPIRIDPPGIPIIDAARRFGVGVNTLKRWAQYDLVRIQHHQREPSVTFTRTDGTSKTLRGADYHWPVPKKFPYLNIALVTTNGCICPGGETFRGPWGELRRMIVEKVPDNVIFMLDRARKPMAAQGTQWQWRCKGCGSFVFKIYWPFAPTPALGSGETMHFPPGWRTGVGGFSCRRCADIAYESAERTSRSSTGRRVDPMDRFCRRLTAGRVAWREVRQLMEQDD